MLIFLNILSQPWPWYLAGPLIGLIIILLQWIDNKPLAASSSYRHICAATLPSGIKFLNYNWKGEYWNLFFVAGIIAGGMVTGAIHHTHQVTITNETIRQLQAAGLTDTSGFAPAQLFSLAAVQTIAGFLTIVLGGFLIGFGSRYAGGCVSGHSMTGISDLQWTSMLATACIFFGGIFTSYILLPFLIHLSI